MKRDLIPTRIRTEFGEVYDTADFHDVARAAGDHTYVEGYSDLRRARDMVQGLRQADYQAHSTNEEEAALGKKNREMLSQQIRKALAVAGITLPTGRIDPDSVPSLPVRLQWTRTSKVISGHPDNSKELQFSGAGYRLVKESDVGQPWFKKLPAGSSIQADGSIKKGDTTLMVCDAKTAARNAAINQLAIQSQTQSAFTPLENMGKPGQTWVETEAGDPIPVSKSRIKQ